MADADFPSRFEQEASRHERAVDEHRRREELEAEVVRLRAEVVRLETLNAELAYSLRGFVHFPTVAINGLDLDQLRRSIEAEAMEIIARSEDTVG
jgi:hypothetical protein